jgi:DNA helicase IV
MLDKDKSLLRDVIALATEKLGSSAMNRMEDKDITGTKPSVRQFNEFKNEEERALHKIQQQPFFARIDVRSESRRSGVFSEKFLITVADQSTPVTSDEWTLIRWTHPICAELLATEPGRKFLFRLAKGSTRGPAEYVVGASTNYEGTIVPRAERVLVKTHNRSLYIEREEDVYSTESQSLPSTAMASDLEPGSTFIDKRISLPSAPPTREHKASVTFGLSEIIIASDSTQRGIMHLPFGESLRIEGPPGSGKTSIGIMRAKCLIDQQWEELGLEKGRNHPFHEYQSMRVLVSNEEMVEYLKHLAASIGVERVPVQSTKKFMRDLCLPAGTLSGRPVKDEESVAGLKGQHEALAAYWAGFKLHVVDVWNQHRAKLSIDLNALPRGQEVVKHIDDWIARVKSAELRSDYSLSRSVGICDSLMRWAQSIVRSVPERSEVPSMPTAQMSKAQAQARLAERESIINQNSRIPEMQRKAENAVRDAKQLVEQFVQKVVDRSAIVVKMFESQEFSKVLEAARRSGMPGAKVVEGEQAWRRQYSHVTKPGYSEHDLAMALWLGVQILLIPERGERPFIGGTLPRLTHIVVDEAQDLSPCQFATLRSILDEKGTLTLVGDLRQNLHAAGGLSNWSEIGFGHLQPCKFAVNYRQTRELGQFVQHLHLSLFREQAGWETSPQLIGTRPRIGRVESWSTAATGVAAEVRHWRSIMPNATVAVLFDNAPATSELENLKEQLETSLQDQLVTVYLAAPGAGGAQLREMDCVHIAAVRQTKGLEFDAVIVVDLNEEWSAGSVAVDRRARNSLYVAASRARSGLTVFMKAFPAWMTEGMPEDLAERIL